MNVTSIAEQLHPVELLAPATDAAGRSSTVYVNTAYCNKIHVRFHVTQGNAATILISILQATAAAGTNSKAGPTCQVWANLDCAANDTLARATDGSTYTTDAGVKHKIVIFEIDASALDVAGGFTYVGISTGASNAANLTSASAEFMGTRYQQATPITVVT